MLKILIFTNRCDDAIVVTTTFGGCHQRSERTWSRFFRIQSICDYIVAFGSHHQPLNCNFNIKYISFKCTIQNNSINTY